MHMLDRYGVGEPLRYHARLRILELMNRMTAVSAEHVLAVRHWTDTQFSVLTTRRPALRFENGQFLMLGIHVNERPLLRAYSICSANHEDHLEFLSIKVPDGPLTSRLQHIRVGDPILVSQKPTGTLVLRDLNPGRRLYLLSTGTGVAPFMSIVKDPEVYERFEKIVLVHGTRWLNETEVTAQFVSNLRRHEHLGTLAHERLLYYPAVTREPHPHSARITTLIESGRLFSDLNLPAFDAAEDRVMLCGSPSMLADCCQLLDERGFNASPHIGVPGDYLLERAFVQK
jgi:ferredoxin/flavodoxin---NADP+ reductase